MSNVDSVFKGIVDECREDYVGLWVVVKDVRRAIPDPPTNIVDTTLALIKRLLLEGDIIAGNFNTDIDNDFHEWKMPIDEIIAKIRREWEELGQDPTGGDIVWFTTSDRKGG
jgi:hypothetical protein